MREYIGAATRNLRVRPLLGLGILALIVLVLVNSYTVVDAGTRGVVKTLGEVTGVFDEGLHFRTPFVTSVVVIDVRTQRYEANVLALSNDLQSVTTQVVLNYRITPSEVGVLVKEVGTGYVVIIIDPAIQESAKAAIAQFTAEELITQRPLVKEAIRVVLEERLTPHNILVDEISITDFDFSEQFKKAVEDTQVAEQEILRAARDLERIQIEAQQQVTQAEAEAEAKLSVAQAEGEALRLQRNVISPALLQLRFIEKWDGVLPMFLTGESGLIPLINIPQEVQPQE